jgi:hypothetical protein
VDHCGCGRSIKQPVTGRRRKRCEVCSPPEGPRRPRVLADVDAASAPGPSVPGPVVLGEVEVSLRLVLERAGREGRYQAVLALRLARQLDSGTSVAGAQGLASQIDSLMQAALDGVPPEADFVDEVAGRRAAVRGAG